MQKANLFGKSLIIILFLWSELAYCIDLILMGAKPTCTVLVSSFDPIKVEANFPAIGSKKEGDSFKMSLLNQKTQIIQQTFTSQDNRVYRTNLYLDSNVLYSLCFQFVTQRTLGPRDVIFIGFVAEQHFEEKIGKIEIPSELANETNIKFIYQTGSKILELNADTINKQKKQRELEDKLVDLSLHKGQRVMNITVIECLVIIISGLYQIIALRRFLIEKNLY